MKYHQPSDQPTNPNASFTDGNPATGANGSIVPAASIEFTQREIVNFETLSGLVPADTEGTTITQLAEAVQTSAVHWGLDVGAPNELQVALSPTPVKYYTGMVVRICIGNDITNPSTINCNAIGPKNITIAGQSTTAGLFAAGMVMDAIYDGTQFQVIGGAAVLSALVSGPGVLTANKNYYVNGYTGSDTAYDGTSATVVGTGPHGPFQSIQRAVNQVPLFNLNGYILQINVADYPSYGAVRFAPINGPGGVYIIGNQTTPANCLINTANSSCFQGGNYKGTYTVSGFKVECSGSAAGDAICGFSVSGGDSVLVLGNVTFGACVGAHIAASQSAVVSNYVSGSQWVITGGCSGNASIPGCFMFSTSSAIIQNSSAGGPIITVTGAVTFAGPFVYAQINSLNEMFYNTLTGGGYVTGVRYYVTANAIIVSNSGPTYWPGTTGGSEATGGQYI